MPFVTPERRKYLDEDGTRERCYNFYKPKRRKYLDEDGTPLAVGDRCYNFYKPMVEQWKLSSKWATAHNIYKNMKLESQWLTDYDDVIAYNLAWQVFFQLHVMPYELKKREENGDI